MLKNYIKELHRIVLFCLLWWKFKISSSGHEGSFVSSRPVNKLKHCCSSRFYWFSTDFYNYILYENYLFTCTSILKYIILLIYCRRTIITDSIIYLQSRWINHSSHGLVVRKRSRIWHNVQTFSIKTNN